MITLEITTSIYVVFKNSKSFFLYACLKFNTSILKLVICIFDSYLKPVLYLLKISQTHFKVGIDGLLYFQVLNDLETGIS